MVLQRNAAVNPFLPAVIQHGWQTGLSEPLRIKEVKAQAVTTSKEEKQKVGSNLILTVLRTSLKSLYAASHLHRVGNVHWWFFGTKQVGWDSMEDVNTPVFSFGLWEKLPDVEILITCSRRFRVKSSTPQEGACLLHMYAQRLPSSIMLSMVAAKFRAYQRSWRRKFHSCKTMSVQQHCKKFNNRDSFRCPEHLL